MRIVFIANSSALYGANKSLVDLLFFLRKRNVDILVITPLAGAFDQYLKNNNIDVKVIPFEFNYHENTILSNIKTPLRFVRRLYKSRMCLHAIRAFQPNLIYSNSSVINVGFFLAKYLNLPHIWHIREDIFSNYSYEFDFGKGFQNLLFRLSDVIIANSYYTLKIKVGLSESTKVRVIYNGVFYKDQLKKLNKTYQKELRNIAVVGLLHPYKGQAEAIIAFGKLLKFNASLKLHIIGSGSSEYLMYLKTLVSKLEITDNVVFHGYVADMKTIYQAIDILLVYAKGEAMGRVTVEAMAFGIPVIGYRSGGTIEIIEHGKNGFLFDTDDEMVNYVERVSNDGKLYEELCAGAKNSAIQKYTIDLYGESVYSVIQETLASKPLL